MRSMDLLPASLCLVLLAGCTDKPVAPAVETVAATSPVAAAVPALVAGKARLILPVPTGMHLSHDFHRGYLDDDSWKMYAGADNTGTPIGALVLNGSEKMMAAELRVGTSTDAHALAHCTDVPDNAVPGSTASATLDGVAFQHFTAEDAGMGHALKVEGYRGMHAGTCIAIDLLVMRTNPAMYENPPPEPFTAVQAWTALHGALDGLHWSR